MKILYGVQGTGQGHISRSRAMAQALQQWPVEVTWLFSGRPRDALFDMELFGDFQHRRGLTFASQGGRISHWATLRQNSPLEFWRDVRQLDLNDYDIIVSDYEPVTAWAARRCGRRVIGIGHQYAFGDSTPRAGNNWWSEFIMRHFAPVDVPLGLHWHPYADNVLPPILDLPALPTSAAEHILVYLPFEDQDRVTDLLQRFPQQRFVQYSAQLQRQERGNVSRYKADVHGFKRHLAESEGVICNSGFELISECLQWRKPVLTKPLQGQMEQESNALALSQLEYATVVKQVDESSLGAWLTGHRPVKPLVFPDVAECLARWLATGCNTAPALLARRMWGALSAPATSPPLAALPENKLADVA